MEIKFDLNDILTVAVQLKASDIHFSVALPPIFRINGELQEMQGAPKLTEKDTEELAKLIVEREQLRNLYEEGECDISYSVIGLSRFRMNIYKQRNVFSIAVRVIPTSIPSIEEIGIPLIAKQFVNKTEGLVLITGPTGSGKSTTLASMIHYMNREMRRHIVTLEDPIEYLHLHDQCIIDQREVGKDTKNFANGLRAALRQDPDVILVGELRDLETISTALSAAETGHLVLATVHTLSAPSTIERIIDIFPAVQQGQVRIQLATCLVGIISQRLFQRKDRKGLAVATEVLVNNAAVANLIRTEKIHQIINVLQTSRQIGMHTLQGSVQELVTKGIVSNELVVSYL